MSLLHNLQLVSNGLLHFRIKRRQEKIIIMIIITKVHNIQKVLKNVSIVIRLSKAKQSEKRNNPRQHCLVFISKLMKQGVQDYIQ